MQRLKRYGKRIAIGLACLYVIYAISFGLIVPWLVKHYGPDKLSDMLDRPVAIEGFSINPFLLSVTAENFVIESNDDGPALFEFERFHADFEVSSLWRKSFHFKAIELDKPQGAIAKQKDGKLNIDDLIELINELSEEEDEPEEEQEVEIPAFSVAHLYVQNAGFQFTDHSREGSPKLKISPVSYELKNFDTLQTEEGNNYEFKAAGPGGGDILWTGRITLSPIAVDGNVQFDKLELSTLARFFNEFYDVDLASSELSLDVDYKVTIDDDFNLQLNNGQATLANTHLTSLKKGLDNAKLLELAALQVEGFSLDTKEFDVAIDNLAVKEPKVYAALLKDEKFNWVEAFSPINEPAEESIEDAEEEAEEAIEEASKSPWHVSLANVELAEGELEFIDQEAGDDAKIHVKPLNATLSDVHWPSEDNFTANADLQLTSGGTVKLNAKGSTEPVAISGDVTIADADLPHYNVWLEDFFPLVLGSGKLSAQQAFTFKLSDKPELTANGDISVQDMELQEDGSSPFVTWQDVTAKQTAFDLQKQSIEIGELLVSSFDGELILDKDGNSWLNAFNSDDDEKETQEATATAESDDQPWGVVIRRINLKDNNIVYGDKSMSPTFKIAYNKIDGYLTNIDTTSKQKSEFKFSSRIDKTAPFSLEGDGYLLEDPIDISFNSTLENYEMSRLTPFTGWLLGYTTKSGQLNITSKVSISQNELDSHTDILAKRFYLDEKTDSEEAIKAPIKLGLSVLRNRKENIKLPLVANGDLNDPSVSVRKLITTTLSNVIVRAATSPFSVLMGLGDSSDQEYLPFRLGSIHPSEEAEEMIPTLVDALKDRPKLRLELKGTIAEADKKAIATHFVGSDLLGKKWQGNQAAVTDERARKKILKAHSKLDNGSELEGDEQQKATQALEELAEARIADLPDEELLQLADRRVDNLKALLIDSHDLSSDRISIGRSSISDSDEAGVKIFLHNR